MATLSTYVGKVQKEMGDQGPDTKTVIERNCKSIYQQVVPKVARMLVGTTPQTQTAIVGTASYTTTDPFLEMVAIHYKTVGASDFVLIDRISEDDFLKSRVNLDNGTPEAWYINGGNFELSPAPSDAGTIRTTSVPVQAELDEAGTVTSIIPDRYEDVIVMGTLYRMFAYEKGPEAIEYKQMYDEAFKYMMDELKTRTKQLKVKLYGC